MGDNRVSQIKEELQSTNTQLQYKEKRVETGAAVKNVKLCDILMAEVTLLNKTETS